MLVNRRVTPSIKFASTHLYTWWREALWELSVLSMNTTQCRRPGLEPRPLDPESSALTMRQLCLPIVSQWDMQKSISSNYLIPPFQITKKPTDTSNKTFFLIIHNTSKFDIIIIHHVQSSIITGNALMFIGQEGTVLKHRPFTVLLITPSTKYF